MTSKSLFALERGGTGSPIVLLHGFGGSHRIWRAVIGRLPAERRLIAYDLPGHAASLAVSHGGAAKAVLADLERRGATSVHLVGHSMGGGVAALAALRAPERVARLTLLAPGGFGRAINAPALRSFAAATETAELRAILQDFFAPESAMAEAHARECAEERRRPGAAEALRSIIAPLDGAEQTMLPLAALVELAIPITVAWGTEDRVLPVAQARELPPEIGVRLFEGAGHMLPLEIPEAVAALILEEGAS